jgi:hypothetical protein
VGEAGGSVGLGVAGLPVVDELAVGVSVGVGVGVGDPLQAVSVGISVTVGQVAAGVGSGGHDVLADDDVLAGVGAGESAG